MPPHQAKRTQTPAEASGAPETAQDGRISATVTVDGEAFTLYLDEVTSAMEIALFRASGLSVEEVLGSPEWPRFQLSAVVFLARRARGEDVSYDHVADSMPWDADITIAEGGDGPNPSDG